MDYKMKIGAVRMFRFPICCSLAFCQASKNQMIFLCWLLMWFEDVSKLRINLDKSKLIPVGRWKMTLHLSLVVGE